MEAGGDVRGRPPVLAPLVPEAQHLDTVRALHQTVVALRVALEKSRAELQQLRQKVQTHIDTSVYVDTIERLSLENHILRQRVLSSSESPEGQGLAQADYALRVDARRDTPSPGAATYTLSPVPEAMDASPLFASPRDKEKSQEAAPLSAASPKALSPSPAGAAAAKSPRGPPASISPARPAPTPAPTLENGESMATAADGGGDVEPEPPAGGGGGGAAAGAAAADDEADGEPDGAGGGDSEDEEGGDSEELDDIELIFTTEETKELGVLQEDLVPIADAEEDGVWPPLQFESADGDEGDAGVPAVKPTPITGAAPTSRAPSAKAPAPAPAPANAHHQHHAAHHDGKDACAGGPRAWARSVLVETDISKCGVVEEGAEVSGRLSRRNTLPAPLGFPPVMLLAARDGGGGGGGLGLALGLGLGAGTRPFAVKFAAGGGGGGGGGGRRADADLAQRFPARPILVERCRGAKRENEAQTDITALPAHWRSESALAQKVSHAFTTLPSKFALPEAALGGAGGGGGGGSGGGGGGGGALHRSGRRGTLRLADKTQEARRTLLSDINFTSMVPELSRSADHLCGEDASVEAEGGAGGGGGGGGGAGLLLRQYPRAFSYMKNADFGLSAGGGAGSLVSPSGYGVGGCGGGSKDAWSPCTCTCACACACSTHSHCCRHGSWDSYSSVVSGGFGGSAGGGGGGGGGVGAARYRGSLSALEGAAGTGKLRRHSWRAEARSCGALAGAAPRSWGSVPSSPTHHGSSCSSSRAARGGGGGGGWPAASPRDGAWPGDSQGSVAASRGSLGLGLGQGLGAGRRSGPDAATSPAVPGRLKPRNRVTFQEGGGARRVQPGQSLPDLRAEWDPDSGDSTDSLIDEAEEYLRRSIDSILTGADVGRVGRRRQLRRYSEPDPIRELAPPQSAQPFLPKVPRDLKLDYFVKVITAEGRVMVGRVRYVGSVPGRSDPHVGVELPKAAGDSDGSCQGRRFFDCDPDYALFVPFKKVVMAWSV